MDMSDLVIITVCDLDRVEWQASIDRQAFAIPLNLTDAAWTSAGMPATFGGKSVVLRLAPIAISTLPRSPGARYRQAIVVDGKGDLQSSAAGLAAALAYAAAAGGVGYVPETGDVKPLAGVRALLDGMLTVIAEANAGQPAAGPAKPGGSMTIRARRAQ